MAYNALYNFGSVKIWASDPSVYPEATSRLFNRAIGTISYTPVWNYDYLTNTGKRIRSLKGYRVNISISSRFFNDTDSQALQFLINQINYYTPMNGIQQPLYIAPRYDSTKIYNNIYACVMTSDFSPIDISNSLSVGQSLLLTFQTILLRPNIEYNINFTNQSVVDDDENIWTIDVDGSEVLLQIIGTTLTG